MDRSLKERLIGAAVLVGLAVWLIPWLLDGPVPVVDTASEALQIPAPESSTSLQTRTIRLDESRPPSAPAEERDAASPGPAPADASSAQGAPDALEASAGPAEEATAPADEERTPADAGPAAETSGEAWLVQLGSFSDEENARRLADRVATHGHVARLSTHTSGGQLMYRVRVGPEPDRESAASVASFLRAEGFIAAQVVSSD